MTTKTHLSGWCSPWCSPRSHATCQERLERRDFERCDCIKGHAALEEDPK